MYGAIYGDLVGSVYEYDQTRKIRGIKQNYMVIVRCLYEFRF